MGRGEGGAGAASLLRVAADHSGRRGARAGPHQREQQPWRPRYCGSRWDLGRERRRRGQRGGRAVVPLRRALAQLPPDGRATQGRGLAVLPARRPLQRKRREPRNRIPRVREPGRGAASRGRRHLPDGDRRREGQAALGRPRDLGEQAMADLFVSYSRKDKEFVRRLVDGLTGRDKDVWIDWEDIAPTADWQAEIDAGIDGSDSFAFVITPDSLGSRVCEHELRHAVEHGKRIVPLLRREPNGAAVPADIA